MKGGRRLRPHRLRGRQAGGPAHGTKGPGRGGEDAGARGDRDERPAHAIGERGKVEEFVVELDHGAPKPDAHRGARERPGQHSGHGKSQVVLAHLEVAVPERLEHGDLGALRGDQPAQHDVEQKRRHGQEDRRNRRPHRPQLVQFALDDQMRRLVFTPVRAAAAVRRQQPVDVVEDVVDVGARRQGKGRFVEGAFHVVGRPQRVPAHPDDAVPLVIRVQRARGNGVDVLGRDRGADDRQVASAAVDDRPDRVARTQGVGAGEVSTGDDFVPPARRDVPAALQVEVAQHRPSALWNRDEPSRSRHVEARHVERRRQRDAGCRPQRRRGRPAAVGPATRGRVRAAPRRRESATIRNTGRVRIPATRRRRASSAPS